MSYLCGSELWFAQLPHALGTAMQDQMLLLHLPVLAGVDQLVPAVPAAAADQSSLLLRYLTGCLQLLLLHALLHLWSHQVGSLLKGVWRFVACRPAGKGTASRCQHSRQHQCLLPHQVSSVNEPAAVFLKQLHRSCGPWQMIEAVYTGRQCCAGRGAGAAWGRRWFLCCCWALSCI